MTEARAAVCAILARVEPPAWVQADLTDMTARERQAACKRLAYWLLRLLDADHPEYEPPRANEYSWPDYATNYQPPDYDRPCHVCGSDEHTWCGTVTASDE